MSADQSREKTRGRQYDVVDGRKRVHSGSLLDLPLLIRRSSSRSIKSLLRPEASLFLARLVPILLHPAFTVAFDDADLVGGRAIARAIAGHKPV